MASEGQVPELALTGFGVRAPGGRHWLVREVSLGLAAGEMLCVVGPSGAGKSTLVRAILGLLPFAAGELRFAGETVARPLDAVHQRLRRASQAVFQQPVAALNPYRTLLHTIMEPLRARGVSEAAARARALELAARVALPVDCLARPPARVSVGQCQRACLARAFISGPRLLFLDEPLSALDAVVQYQLVGLLEALRQHAPPTVVMVSHDLRWVRRLATRVAVMDAGRLVEWAPTAEFLAAPRHPVARALVASFRRREARWRALCGDDERLSA